MTHRVIKEFRVNNSTDIYQIGEEININELDISFNSDYMEEIA